MKEVAGVQLSSYRSKSEHKFRALHSVHFQSTLSALILYKGLVLRLISSYVARILFLLSMIILSILALLHHTCYDVAT